MRHPHPPALLVVLAEDLHPYRGREPSDARLAWSIRPGTPTPSPERRTPGAAHTEERDAA